MQLNFGATMQNIYFPRPFRLALQLSMSEFARFQSNPVCRFSGTHAVKFPWRHAEHCSCLGGTMQI